MTKTFYAIFAFLFFAFTPGSAESKGLEMIEMEGVMKVFYNPDLVSNDDAGQNDKNSSEQWPDGKRFIVASKILPSDENHYCVHFTQGMSSDPEFIIEECASGAIIGAWGGTQLTIPGDGYIYISGHTNNMFDEHRKFYVDSHKKLKEVSQPFYYIGIETIALRPFNIASDQTLQTIVDKVRADEKITVILADNRGDGAGENLYLIKTERDLLGWFKIPDDGFMFPGSLNKPYFDGVFYNGD